MIQRELCCLVTGRTSATDGQTYQRWQAHGISATIRRYSGYGGTQTINYGGSTSGATSGAAGSGSSHSHSMSGSVSSAAAGTTFTPSYIDIIVAAKDA